MKQIKKLGGVATLLGAMFFASAPLRSEDFTLENDQVAVTCATKGGQLLPGTLRDKTNSETVNLGGELFSLELTNGAYLHANQFKLVGKPRVAPLPVNPGASRRAERLPGKELVAELVGADGNVRVTWHAILRDGSRYLRQEFVFQAGKTRSADGRCCCWTRPAAGRRAPPARWTARRC